MLCDEATSALDPQTTQSILELIRDINKKMNISVIVITHQMSVVEKICNKGAILDGGVVAEKGEVSEVFTAPKSDAAKRLVFPVENSGDSLSAPSDESVIRVVYNGAYVADKPLITQMAIDENIAANILAAQTKCLGDKVYGNMLLGISGGDDNLKRAVAYLEKTENIIVQEVSHNA